MNSPYPPPGQTASTPAPSSKLGDDPLKSEVRSATRDAKDTGAALKEETARVASEVREQGSKLAEEVKTVGQDLGSAAAKEAEALADQGKQAGVERGLGLAHATRRVADDLEGTSPEIARHVRTAADSIEGVADSLRQRSVGDLLQDASTFARQQPAAFFGAAALAGFAIARFAKSSASGSSMSGTQAGPAHRAPSAAPAVVTGRAPGWVPAGEPGTDTLKPATMSAATLGGAAAHKPGDAQPGSMPTIGKEIP
jgi:hypothetical protein